MIIGHEKICSYIRTALSGDHLSHAYLFYGPKQVGKETVARWFAQSLLCTAWHDNPCMTCVSCILAKKGTHPNIFLLSCVGESSEITIRQIRSLRTHAAHTSFHHGYKIYLINPANVFTAEASHALLKLLEEPQEKTVFILISDGIEQILPTIISRCEVIPFSLVPPPTIIQALSDDFTKEQKHFIARLSHGKVGKALTLDKEAIQNIIEREKQILKILKSPLHIQMSLLSEFIERDPDSLELTGLLLHDILLSKVGLDHRVLHTYFKKELGSLAKALPLKTLHAMLNKLQRMPALLANNIQQQNLWCNVFLELHRSP